MIWIIIICLIAIAAGVAASSSSKKETRKPVRTFDYYERHGITLPTETPNPEPARSDLTEEILFEVVGVGKRPKHIRKQAADLQIGDDLELMVGFRGNKHIVEVVAGFERIGYVDEDDAEEVYQAIVHGDEYECKVFTCEADWDTDVTAAGNFVDVVADVWISALMKFKPVKT